MAIGTRLTREQKAFERNIKGYHEIDGLHASAAKTRETNGNSPILEHFAATDVDFYWLDIRQLTLLNRMGNLAIVSQENLRRLRDILNSANLGDSNPVHVTPAELTSEGWPKDCPDAPIPGAFV